MNEALETVLNHDRPMGYYADELGTEERGISACYSMKGLLRWVRTYSANIKADDYIMEINGEDRDGQDHGEVVCLPTRFEVIGRGSDLLAAMAATKQANGDDDDLIEILDMMQASEFARELAAILND
jgi:hypothetical protein